MLNTIKVKDGLVRIQEQMPLMNLRRELGGVSDRELGKLTKRELGELLEENAGGNYVGWIGFERE